MIKYTQNVIGAGRCAGSDMASGLSCPEYELLVKVFGFRNQPLRKEDDMEMVISEFLEADEAVVLKVIMAPDQLLVPKFSVSITPEGKRVSPPLEDLSPLMLLEVLEKSLQVLLYPNSILVNLDYAEVNWDAIY